MLINGTPSANVRIMPSGEEKRASPRHKTLKQGRIILSDWTTLDCTIRDLSDQGARVLFGGPTALPATFSLEIISSQKVIPAELVRQQGLTASIRFTGPERPAHAGKS